MGAIRHAVVSPRTEAWLLPHWPWNVVLEDSLEPSLFSGVGGSHHDVCLLEVKVLSWDPHGGNPTSKARAKGRPDV